MRDWSGTPHGREEALRIGVAVGSFAPAWTSAATLYGGLVDWLRKEGHEVHVLTLSEATTNEFPPNASGIDRSIKRIPAKHWLHRRTRWLRSAFEIWRTKADVQLVYSPPLPLAFTAVVACKLSARAVVVHVQDLHPMVLQSMGLLTNRLVVYVLEFFEWFVYTKADHLIVYSELNAVHVSRRAANHGPVSVIPNWAVESSPTSDRQAFPHQQVVPPGRTTLIYAGHLGTAQGLRVWAEAASDLEDQGIDAHIVIYGDGPEMTVLRELSRATTRLDVFDPVKPTDYSQLLRVADVGIVSLDMSVSTETIPGKLANLFAAGLPVLATAPLGSDLVEQIALTGAGRVVAAGDKQALVAEIKSLVTSPELKAELAEASRNLGSQSTGTLSDSAIQIDHILRQSATG